MVPSIFNDVIGPVMRGPSSSHSAAAVRIGRIGRDLMGGELTKVTIRFDEKGSLPTTYLSQGSDMGLSGGLLGLEADDEKLVDYRYELKKQGIELHYEIGDYGDTHPNTYNLILENGDRTCSLKALSTGGGMVEILSINDIHLSFCGDAYGLLIEDMPDCREYGELLNSSSGKVFFSDSGEAEQVFIVSPNPFQKNFVDAVSTHAGSQNVKYVMPVLPVLSCPGASVPFLTSNELLTFTQVNKLGNLADAAVCYESARGGLSEKEVLQKALYLVDIIENAIKKGLAGTKFTNRILGCQSKGYVSSLRQRKLLDLGVLDSVIPSVTALMEVKSSMGVIVAAPTAGSCGAVPGSLIAVANNLDCSREQKARAILAAGITGVLVAARSTFSAEICGCQAECGVASGMVAAAVSSMAGGDIATSMAAASIALQNSFGMVCDPVASRVEVPCLGKNILAATNGISCANLALSGYDHVIPFDEVVSALDSVGRSLPHELRCTALGGLSISPTSRKIEEMLRS